MNINIGQPAFGVNLHFFFVPEEGLLKILMLADATNKLEQKASLLYHEFKPYNVWRENLKKREDHTYSTLCISVGKRLDSSSHSNKNSI